MSLLEFPMFHNIFGVLVVLFSVSEFLRRRKSNGIREALYLCGHRYILAALLVFRFLYVGCDVYLKHDAPSDGCRHQNSVNATCKHATAATGARFGWKLA